MTDYLHVWEIMKHPNNDPKGRVLIERPASNSDTEPLCQIVYDGQLRNVPPQVALERVQRVDRSVTYGCPNIILFADSTEEEAEEFRQELIAACEADPFLAKKIWEYLSASEYGRQLMESKVIIEALEA